MIREELLRYHNNNNNNNNNQVCCHNCPVAFWSLLALEHLRPVHTCCRKRRLCHLKLVTVSGNRRFCPQKQVTLYPKTGDFVARNKIACFGIQSRLKWQQSRLFPETKSPVLTMKSPETCLLLRATRCIYM